MSDQLAPVITPAELAAIIRKAQSKGFAPTGHGRPGIAADGDDFRPADFETMARSAAPALLKTDSTIPNAETADTGAAPVAQPKAVPTRKAFAEPEPETIRDFDAELAAARDAAYQQGVSEGLAQGRAEAAADALTSEQSAMASARAAFLAATEALSKPSHAVQSSLAEVLSTSIRDLAAERAGMAIDAHPLPFLHRIERLADRVSQGIRQVAIALHPDDLAAIQTHLGEGETGWNGLKADPKLARGDVVVTGPGVRLADLIAADAAGALE